MSDGIAAAGVTPPGRLRQALWTAGLSALGLGVAALALREDRLGTRTLSPLAPFVDGAVAAGGAIAEWAGGHRLAVGATAAALALLAALAGVLRGRTAAARPRALLAGALALVFATLLLLWSGQLLLAGLAAVASGVALLVSLPAERHGGDPGPGWIALPLAAGAILRFFTLAEVPGSYSQHSAVHHLFITIPLKERLAAAWAAGDVAAWWHAVSANLLSEQFGADALVSAAGFSLFGVGLTPSRLTCALLGTLTIAVAWRVGSLAGGRRTGLIFALLLALSPWHVSISRYGDAEHVLSPLQLLLVLLLFLEARATGSLVSMALGGALLATAWLVYASNQVTPLVFLLAVLLGALLETGPFRKEAWKWGVAAAVFVLLSAAPVAAFVRDGHLLPNLRMGYESERPALWDSGKRLRILEGIGRELFVDGSDPWFNEHGGSFGLLEASLLVPGLLLAFASLRRGPFRDVSRFVVVAIPVTILPGLFAPDVSFRRLFLLATVVLLLAAVVLSRIVDGLFASGVPPGAIRLAGAAAGALLFVLSAHVYFDRVHVESEENSRLQTGVASLVRRTLGETGAVVVLFPGQRREEYDDFIRFAAYEELRRIREGRTGDEDRPLWGYWSCSNDAEKSPVFPDGVKTRCLVVPSELVADPGRCSGVRLEERAAEWLPGAVRETTLTRRREPLFFSWCAPAPAPGPARP